MTPPPNEAAAEVEGLRIRKWDSTKDTVTIQLTGRPDDAGMKLLNEAVWAFGRRLSACPARGEIRITDGKVLRFIERELEGDKWEVLGDLAPETRPANAPVEGLDLDAGKRWWWLSELGPHGYGKPIDGPHDAREGVEEAAYLMARLGLQRDRQFVCAEIIETPVHAKSHGANEEAITTLNSIGLAPARASRPTPAEGVDLDALEKVARAADRGANGGGWSIDPIPNYQGDPDLVGSAIVSPAVMIAEVRGATQIDGKRCPNANLAEHIATFDPPTVLKLIAAARASRPTPEAEVEGLTAAWMRRSDDAQSYYEKNDDEFSAGKAAAYTRCATELRELLASRPANAPVEGLDLDAGKRWWWLSELGPHGYGKPIDGPHDAREGVEEAAYLMARLGLQRDRQFVCAEIIETPVHAKSHGANEEAITTLNSIGLAPARASRPTPAEGVDLDALEKVARSFIENRAVFAALPEAERRAPGVPAFWHDARTMGDMLTPEVVLKLIALARSQQPAVAGVDEVEAVAFLEPLVAKLESRLVSEGSQTGVTCRLTPEDIAALRAILALQSTREPTIGEEEQGSSRADIAVSEDDTPAHQSTGKD